MSQAAMSTVTIHKAKTELSKLIALVEAGEEVTILRRDKPVARLVAPEAPVKVRRQPGMYPELKAIPDDLFLTPMTPDELALWYGKE
jgi:prevent-host-death family protein